MTLPIVTPYSVSACRKDFGKSIGVLQFSRQLAIPELMQHSTRFCQHMQLAFSLQLSQMPINFCYTLSKRQPDS